MYERLTKCPLCKSGQFINHMVVKDLAITKESFIICKCNDCQLWFTNPRPDLKNIHKYYDSDEYISHNSKSKGIINFLYKLVRTYTIKQKVNWINEKFNKKGKLLDFGCGTGHFLKAMKKNGWDTVGYEPNSKAANIAISDKQVKLVTSVQELKDHKKFDAITLFHVLEHVHDLNRTIKILLDKLKKRGILFIAVPNRNAKDAIHFKEHWAAFDMPRHLYHFNHESMSFLADKHNCRIINIKPMPFDSFYVSILSNKFLGNNSILNSMLIGLKSNQAAKINDMNYSSLLFILKKK